MKSISSFDAMSIVNPPEINDSPSMTVVTPCIDIKSLMDRVLRGLQSPIPVGSDDYEMTTDEEYRNSPMCDEDFIDSSDDVLVDMSNLQRNIDRMKSYKPAAVKAPRQDAAREDDSPKPTEAEKPPKQPE